MNHRWKKIDTKIGYVLQRGISDYHHYPKLNKECVQCGLRKGVINTLGYFPRTIYFRDHNILSIDRIPSPCLNINFHLKEDFISIEEMQI